MRTRLRWILTAAVAVATLIVAGCSSGGGPSPASYRKALDAECASAEAFNRHLSVLERTEHLDVHQLEVKAGQQAATFVSAVTHLTPPGSLAAAQQRLATTLHNPPSGDSPAKLLPFARSLLADYTALGATGCETFERQAVASVTKPPPG